MSMSPIASSSAVFTAAVQQQSTSAAVQPATHETENDGDKDDGAKTVQAPSPSVNLYGQKVGTTINVTA